MGKTQEALEALESDWDGCVNSPKGEAITAIRKALAKQPAHPDCDCGRELHEMHRPGCAYAKSKVEAATRDQQARYRAHIEDEWRKLNAEQPAQQPHVHAISGKTADELWLETGRLRSELADLKAQQQGPLTGGDERRHIICLCPDCTKPAQQQEPVAIADGTFNHNCPIGTPLYTSPPASKPWVGLTDEERDDIWERHHTTLGGWDYGGDDVMYDRHFEPAVVDIEAKLREKNA